MRPATADRLFLWVMHRFAEVFEDHAIVRGGMALRLLDSPRATNDIDYVFVPYTSKKDVLSRIKKVLAELDDARVEIALHSTMLRADLHVDAAAIQIEVSVAMKCKATAMATGGMARANGEASRVVRIMSLDTALAHKIAAWNERRLLRDLYDCYFLVARLGELPDRATLDARLAQMCSQLPGLKKRKRTSRSELASALRETAKTLTQGDIDNQLAPLLPTEECAGLALRIRAALSKICDWLEE